MTSSYKTGIRRWFKGLMLKYMHRMITCKEFENFVLSYLDGELTKTQHSAFELHLRVCRECREYLAAYKRSIEVGRVVFKLPDDELPEDVPEDLIKAILNTRDL